MLLVQNFAITNNMNSMNMMNIDFEKKKVYAAYLANLCIKCYDHYLHNLCDEQDRSKHFLSKCRMQICIYGIYLI